MVAASGRGSVVLSSTTSSVRVQNSRIARAILSSRASAAVFMWAMGGGSLLRYRYPRRRAEFVFRTFFSDAEQDRGALSKLDLESLLERLGTRSPDTFGAGLFAHVKDYLGEDRARRVFFFDLFREFLTNEIHRESLAPEDRITALTIDVTQRCNIRCTHCFADSTPEIRDDLDLESTLRFMDEAVRDGGCRFFAILGGEPLLEVENLRQMAKAFPRKPFVVFTNGSMVTDKTCAKLKDCPNVSFFVSIEGFQELTDRVRGSKAFERADKALATLKRNGMLYGVSLTATKQNRHEIPSADFVKYLDNAGCFLAWIFDLKPIGRAATSETRALVLDAEEKNLFNEAVTKVNQAARFVFINTEKDPAVIGGCPAHKGTYMHVACDGHVTPCIAQRYFDAGVNVATMSFTEVRRSEYLQAFRKIGNGEGCPTRFFPAETRAWIDQHHLQYLYGNPLAAETEGVYINDGAAHHRRLLPLVEVGKAASPLS
jgi:MoaA/NifB/PqqE/SkfB family radical SAM enzyme